MPRWVIGLVILWISVITAVSGVGWRHQEHTIAELERQDARIEAETEERLRDGCERWNANRQDTREMMRRGDLESGEVLIAISSRRGELTAEQKAAIEAYRQLLNERQAVIVEEHTADDRDCEAEARERAEAAD